MKAVVDPALSVRILGVRELHYRDEAPTGEDRPPHVRAASGIAMIGGRLAVVQDDASFIALVGPSGALSIPLPRGKHGRRRFEDALGNKHDKLDLESCVVIAGELWAFGSGSTEHRQHIARVGDEVRLYDARSLYTQLRSVIGGAINIEGVAVVGDELWLFHRGNTGPNDVGPAIVRFELQPTLAAVLAEQPAPAARGIDHCDLGTVGGGKLGFTDAIAGNERVFFLAAAEASANAIDDGPVLGSQLGVIHAGKVRAAPLVVNGAPIKAEGLAFDPTDPMRGWIVIDPDNTELPAPLVAFELEGPWFSS